MSDLLIGNQVPTYMWVPPAFSSASYVEAMEVADRAGIVADPWQKLILKGGLGETEHHRFQCFEVCVIVGRQNGKGAIIEIRELAGLFAFEEKLITHSAHEFKTSSEAFRRMLAFIESVPDFDSQVLRVSRSKGEEGIELTRNRRLRYMARTGGAGRGFTGDCVIMDEAMILDHLPMAALVPTMATRPDPQLWYMGSAGDRRLLTQSVVLAKVRRRGLSRDPSLALFMWEAHRRHEKGKCATTCRLDPRDSPKTHAMTNPAYGIRITGEFLKKMIGTLSGWDFDREFLGAGDYPEDEGWSVVSKDAWTDRIQVDPDQSSVFAVGIKARHDRSEASAAIAVRRKDGGIHVEVVKHELGTAWIPDFVKAFRKKRPCAFVFNSKGPANVVIPEIESMKPAVKIFKPNQQEYAQYCAKWLQMVTESMDLSHNGQKILDDCVANARMRDLGQGLWTWEHEEVPGNVSGLDAVTLAIGGLIVKGRKRGRPMIASVDRDGKKEKDVTPDDGNDRDGN